jgi:hypothetical protein
VPVALAGQMVTLYALSYALLSPVIAAAAAHWPRKRLQLAGLAVFVWERLRYDWSDLDRVVMTTTDSNVWGGRSSHPYSTLRRTSVVDPMRSDRGALKKRIFSYVKALRLLTGLFEYPTPAAVSDAPVASQHRPQCSENQLSATQKAGPAKAH